MNKVKNHFDNLGDEYDLWKKKNDYYYSNVKRLYKSFIVKGKKVLDVGCGTGEILASIEPKTGIGIDISPNLIKFAKLKYKNLKYLEFSTKKVSEIKDKNFDFIILSDVIEHLENIKKIIGEVAGITNSDTKVIITMANPAWEPLLEIAEKFKLKMPEGPHSRISDSKLLSIMSKEKFKLLNSGSRLILPIKIWKISDFVNSKYYNLPFIKNCGVIHFFVFKKEN